ncbi:putative glycosyltransferase [Leptolyngbya sp. PCC 7375]|nr:putative glycosyltransferase [Leptolyngbya sp. PCC 7375]
MDSLTSMVTIVVTQRERFSYSQKSLENLYANTTYPFRLIYVDGNSPKPVQSYLEEQSKVKGFRLIRKERYLFPNEARNLVLPEVDTRYVVFLDNDVEFKLGWLKTLVDCAEETGAWLVGPLYCEGPLDPSGPRKDQNIHMAGGDVHFRETAGKRRLRTSHRFLKRPFFKHQHEFKRQPTEMIEYHCVLVRTESFEKIGYPDEKLLTLTEHLDICMAVRNAGGEVYFEPDSIVSYVTPPPFEHYDRPFYLSRWSDENNLKSLIHFQKKWDLAEDDPYLVNRVKWGMKHRLMACQLPLNGLLQYRPKSRRLKKIISFPQRAYTRLVARKSSKLIKRLVELTRSAQLSSLF